MGMNGACIENILDFAISIALIKIYMHVGHGLCAQDMQKAKPTPKSTGQASPVVSENTNEISIFLS